MAGSIWGEVFRISTWGESHGEGVGVVVDGAPAGISLSEEDIQKCLDRRKPGETKYSTPRKEGDKVKIMSGVFEGKTTGTPISMVVVNTSQKSGDYSNIANVFRPGHADFPRRDRQYPARHRLPAGYHQLEESALYHPRAGGCDHCRRRGHRHRDGGGPWRHGADADRFPVHL